MRPRPLMVGAGLLLFLSLALVHAGERADIAKLVGQLGSDSFVEREQARKELEAIGAPALAALRDAVRTGDLETARRAGDLIRVIEERGMTAELLRPKKLRLQVKDLPVLQAVEKLAKLSGYTVRVDGDRTLLAGKTVTLDTGEVTFWEAVDRLGAAAGLVEKLTVASLPGDPNAMDAAISMYLDVLGRPAMPKKAMRKGPPPPPPLRRMPLPKLEDKKDDKESPPGGLQEIQTKEVHGEVDGTNRFPGPAPGNPAPQVMPGRVILAPGAPAKQYVSYAGAARVLLKHAKAPTGAKSPGAAGKYYDLVLEASAEPRLLGFTVVGVPAVTRAVDEHGQVLSFVIDPTPAVAPRNKEALLEALADFLDVNPPSLAAPPQRGVTLRLQPGAKPAKRLRELTGSLSAQVFVPNSTLLVLDGVLKAKGKTADIKGGGRLKVESITESGGVYQVVYKLHELPGAGNAGVQLIRNGRPIFVNSGPLGNDGGPELLDAKGQRLTRVNGPAYSQENTPEGQVLHMTGIVSFRREAGQGEPARLVLIGTDMPTINVPFRFENVPLN